MEEFCEQPRPEDDSMELKQYNSLITRSGDLYSGQCSLNGKRHGLGKCIFVKGSLYEGFWKDDKPHGRGRLITPDLTVIEGTFQDGVIMMQKKSRYGDEYHGFFNEFGQPHGKCTKKYLQGDSFHGDYFNGVRHGEGLIK